MARVLKGSHSFTLHTPRSSANRMNHTCLCLPRRSWYSVLQTGLFVTVGLRREIICQRVGVVYSHTACLCSVVFPLCDKYVDISLTATLFLSSFDIRSLAVISTFTRLPVSPRIVPPVAIASQSTTGARRHNVSHCVAMRRADALSLETH